MRDRAFSEFMMRSTLAVLAVLGPLPLLVWSAHIREQPSFWTHAGGYPIWLRDLVMVGHYPLLLLSVFGAAFYFYRLIAAPQPSLGALCAEFALLLLMSTAIAAAVVLDLVDHL